jgi:electron transfer flavoprotein alpha subunit
LHYQKRDDNKEGSIVKFEPKLEKKEFVIEILKTVIGESGVQGLFEADIVVTGGRGTTSDSLELIKDLTKVLQDQGIDAQWATSRAVVDEGISEYARQVGQTGKTVRPKVYIAIGISGAIQHIAGMKDSDTIIAINQNSKEPIFQNCDFGIVGTYEDILPELIQRVKDGFTFGIKPS